MSCCGCAGAVCWLTRTSNGSAVNHPLLTDQALSGLLFEVCHPSLKQSSYVFRYGILDRLQFWRNLRTFKG